MHGQSEDTHTHTRHTHMAFQVTTVTRWPKGRIMDYERKVVQQLYAKQYVAWKSDLAYKERK